MAGEESLILAGFFTLCFILFLGIPGNVISIIVWTKGENCSRGSSATYFKLLAVCDLFVLIVPGVDYFMFLYPWNRMDLRLTNNVFCKFLSSAFFMSRDVSVGVTISLTIERALTVCFPFRSWKSDVRTRAYIIFALDVVLSLSFSVPYMLTEEIIEGVLSQNVSVTNSSNVTFTDIKTCTYARDSWYADSIELYTTIHFSCHVIIPLIILTLCNSLILRKLCKDKNQNINADCQTIRKSIHTVTILVVCIGFIHIVSTLPMSLHVIYIHDGIKLSEYWAAFVGLIMQNVVFLNSGINCVLYCFIGEEFRQDLTRLSKDAINWCRNKDRVNSDSVTNISRLK